MLTLFSMQVVSSLYQGGALFALYTHNYEATDTHAHTHTHTHTHTRTHTHTHAHVM